MENRTQNPCINDLNHWNISGCESKREVNTFPSCLLVVLFFIMGSTLGFYRATIFYSNWISIISLLNIVSLLITFILYVRRQTSDFFNSMFSFEFLCSFSSHKQFLLLLWLIVLAIRMGKLQQSHLGMEESTWALSTEFHF